MKDHPHKRLKEARIRAGFTHAIDACNSFGWNPITYRTHESGERGMKQDVAKRYSRAFRVSLSWLLTGEGNSTDNLAQTKVIGRVKAGAWEDVTLDQSFSEEYIPVGPTAPYEHLDHHAYVVEGSSMDRVFQDGDYVVFVDFADTGRELTSGDYVIALRTQGSLAEKTIKRVKITENSIELWPESKDPQFQTPIQLNGDTDDSEVKVVGLVVGQYIRFV